MITIVILEIRKTENIELCIIIIINNVLNKLSNMTLLTFYKDDDIEGRLKKLTAKVDKVSSKTHGMLHRSYQLQSSSENLRNQVDRMQDKY